MDSVFASVFILSAVLNNSNDYAIGKINEASYIQSGIKAEVESIENQLIYLGKQRIGESCQNIASKSIIAYRMINGRYVFYTINF